MAPYGDAKERGAVLPSDSVRINGTDAAANGRVCVECGLPAAPGALYCTRHGGGPGADRWTA